MDLIDRKQAIDSICINICGKSHNDCGFWKAGMRYCNACKFAFLVGNTPSAEKTGKWAWPSAGQMGRWLESTESRMRPFMCSNCGCIYDVDTLMGEPVWNYCPNCGSRMEDEDE